MFKFGDFEATAVLQRKNRRRCRGKDETYVEEVIARVNNVTELKTARTYRGKDAIQVSLSVTCTALCKSFFVVI